MERRINRVIRNPQGRVVRSPETGGYALPEAFEPARNTVFLLKPLYPGEQHSDLVRRYDEEMKYVQRIFRQATNHPAGVQVDSYDLPFSPEQKQEAFQQLLKGEGGEGLLVTQLEVACDDEAAYTERWTAKDNLVHQTPRTPILIERIVRLLASDIVALRLLAVELLGQIGDSIVTTQLMKALYEDTHPDVRAFAAMALGRLGIREARLPIATRALQAPDVGERHDHLCAIALLGGLGDDTPGIHIVSEDPNDPTAALTEMVLVSTEEGLPGVIARLLDPASTRTQRLAALSLIELAPPEEALPALYSLFDEEDEHVRAAAMLIATVQLQESDDLEPGSPAMAPFADVLNKDRSARCREAAAAILGSLGDKSVITLVDRRGLGDPDFLVRDAAERALRQIEDRLFGHHRIRSDADLGIWRR